MLKVGEKLGRYELLAELGRGASGLVLKARDTLLNDVVCIKVLLEGLAGDTATLERFKRELLIARRVTHPGVCKSFDLQTEGDHVFLVMEFVEGEALGHILDRTRPLPVQEAVRILRGACQALGAAHEAGVVHRDLKPGNILIRPDGRVCVVDFGIATSEDMEKLTRPGLVLGSQKYVAPERWSGVEADPRTDVWSLGVILYGCVTGRLPYRGEGLFGVLDAIQQTTPPTPSSLNPEVPRLLDDVIAKALSVDPAGRFQNASEMDEALSVLDMSGWVPTRERTKGTKTSPPEPTATVVVPRDVTLSDPAVLGGASARQVPFPTAEGEAGFLEDHTLEGGAGPLEDHTAESARASTDDVTDPESAGSGDRLDLGGPTVELHADDLRSVADASSDPSLPAVIVSSSLEDSEPIASSSSGEGVALPEPDPGPAAVQDEPALLELERQNTDPSALPLRSQENRIPTVLVKRANETLPAPPEPPAGRGLALGAGAALLGVLIVVAFMVSYVPSASDDAGEVTSGAGHATTGAGSLPTPPPQHDESDTDPGAPGDPGAEAPPVHAREDGSEDEDEDEDESEREDHDEDEPPEPREDGVVVKAPVDGAAQAQDPEPDAWDLEDPEPAASPGAEPDKAGDGPKGDRDPPPARQPRADRAERARYAAAKKALSRAMGEAGLLPGDDARLDALRARANQEARQGRYAAAAAQYEKARKRTSEVVVDRDLVAKKVQRLNRRYDGLKDEAKKREVADALRAVQKSFGKGDWRAANAKLNAALALAGSG